LEIILKSPTTEEAVGKVPIPGSDDRDHHKPTVTRDLKPGIDLRALGVTRDPRKEK
jgi:hypothetical protein